MAPRIFLIFFDNVSYRVKWSGPLRFSILGNKVKKINYIEH